MLGSASRCCLHNRWVPKHNPELDPLKAMRAAGQLAEPEPEPDEHQSVLPDLVTPRARLAGTSMPGARGHGPAKPPRQVGTAVPGATREGMGMGMAAQQRQAGTAAPGASSRGRSMQQQAISLCTYVLYIFTERMGNPVAAVPPVV